MDTDFKVNHNLVYRLGARLAVNLSVLFLRLKLAAVSDGARGAVSRNLCVNIDLISVLYNPISLDRPADQIAPEIDDWWSSGNCKLLSVGRLTPDKGYDVLLESVGLITKCMDPRLLIVGYGPFSETIESMVENLGLKKNIRLIGYHSHPTSFFRKCDVFVTASRSEAMPLVLVEALAAGKRIVATDCDYGPREVLDDGRYGRLVPVDDSVRFATELRDSLMSMPCSRRLKLRAGYFSSEKVIERYLSLLFDQS